MSIRPIRRIVAATPTVEGAGVRLRRAFGFGDTQDFDPFLLLDDFRNERPDDYLAGFPWHPHRGIETITYVLTGTVSHGDSLGNRGTLGAGDVQWMTAGSGIVRGKTGPADGVAADPRYIDVSVPPGRRTTLPVASSAHAFAYVFEGSGTFRDASQPQAVRTELVGAPASAGFEDTGNRSLVLFDSGDEITVRAGDAGVRFLLVSGKPIEEPVAWYGPIVMNTDEQLRKAYAELRDGTFIKHG